MLDAESRRRELQGVTSYPYVGNPLIGFSSPDPGFVSGKWRVPGAGKRLMTWLHYLKDCAEINKMLNASIKSLATIHWPLSLLQNSPVGGIYCREGL